MSSYALRSGLCYFSIALVVSLTFVWPRKQANQVKRYRDTDSLWKKQHPWSCTSWNVQLRFKKWTLLLQHCSCCQSQLSLACDVKLIICPRTDVVTGCFSRNCQEICIGPIIGWLGDLNSDGGSDKLGLPLFFSGYFLQLTSHFIPCPCPCRYCVSVIYHYPAWNFNAISTYCLDCHSWTLFHPPKSQAEPWLLLCWSWKISNASNPFWATTSCPFYFWPAVRCSKKICQQNTLKWPTSLCDLENFAGLCG